MNANASKDSATSKSLMAPTANKISEAALVMMQYFGMKRIEAMRMRSANYERLIATVEFFDGTPEEIRSCAIAIKDSLIGILAAVGIVKLEIESDAEETKTLVAGYEKLVEFHKLATAGSAAVDDAVPAEAAVPAEETSVKVEEPEKGNE